MSRNSPRELPDELRDALDQEEGDAPHEDIPALDALWARLGSARPSDADLPDASDTWAGVRPALNDKPEPEDGPSSSRETRASRPSRAASDRLSWGWTVAALGLLIAALGAWLWQRPITIAAAPGTVVTHTLPDGSTVELNGGSRLRYSRTLRPLPLFEGDRQVVRVRGEAYFEVRPASRPFVVQTSTARIEVTGTAFVVQADTGRTHVALADGSVRVEGPSSARAVVLAPGEAVLVRQDGSISPPADTSIQRVTAWRRGGFAVTAQPLPAIARALERQFGTRIVLSPSLSAKVTSSPLTLYYSQAVTAKTIVHDIAMARGLSYRPRGEDGYVLAPAERSRSPRGTHEQP